MNAFHNACQTFVSQNVGAGKYERISPIVRRCIACQVTLGAVLCTFALTFKAQLIAIYNSDPAVIAAGCGRMSIMAAFYVVFGMADVLTGAIRGYGVPIAPVIINLIGTCVLRLVWISVLDTSSFGVEYVFASYPVTWSVVFVSLSLCYLWLRHKEKKVRSQLC
jgi:Na+-driven multidrug efflux pump